MSPAFLLSDTVVHDDGQSEALDLGPLQGHPLTLTLRITRILQQESLQLSVWGSRDAKTWRRLLVVPPKSYCGTYSQMLDLSANSDIRHLRAQWIMGPWIRTTSRTIFGFSVAIERSLEKPISKGAVSEDIASEDLVSKSAGA